MNRVRTLVLVALIAGALSWGVGRTTTERPVAYSIPWNPGEQLLPPSVPRLVLELGQSLVPDDSHERLAWLDSNSVDWGERRRGEPWRIYVLVSRVHAAVLYLSDAEIERLTEGTLGLARLGPGEWFEASVPPSALNDDRDGDGDPLDPGEITSDSAGVSVFIVRMASSISLGRP